ncbi:hypothetical protein GO730_17105 [Spirosoma sp. HMF3257]|nr:hypothetical protein [Spirosoma telluris]
MPTLNPANHLRAFANGMTRTKNSSITSSTQKDADSQTSGPKPPRLLIMSFNWSVRGKSVSREVSEVSEVGGVSEIGGVSEVRSKILLHLFH